MSEPSANVSVDSSLAPAGQDPGRDSDNGPAPSSDDAGPCRDEPAPAVGMGRGNAKAGVELLLLLRRRRQQRRSPPRPLPTACGHPARHQQDSAQQGQQDTLPKGNDGVNLQQPRPGLARGVGLRRGEPAIGMGRGNPEAGLPLRRFRRRKQRRYG
ncbi:hypothetical protein HPB50_025265 [Hyalomma asiaticum]|uniref:Uncharacterized protein n=1 Tax=Hyalomma asiaticum TaxID=266040 RepID=A0ACB7S9Y7_HYAAI|nr:hypothetical protein HPB50_025265 [Hyalomma asiaticum]